MPVAILGNRGCGKTVFLSLLYHTQVGYTNETFGKMNEFRFWANPGFTKIMGDVVSELIMGNWPGSTMKGLLAKYWFLYGYKKMLPPNKYDTIKFTVYDIAGEDVNIIDELINPYQASGGDLNSINYDDLSEGVKTLLDCNVLVFLLDTSRINAEQRSEAFKEMLKYDTFMATLISLVAEYKSKKGCTSETKNRIYPVFVFTKYDCVDKKILENMKIPSKPPCCEKKHLKERKKIVDTIMKAFYPQTNALRVGGTLVNVDFVKGGFFFSYMEVAVGEDSLATPIATQDPITKAPSLVYSREEYKAFIEYFRDIARDMPDDIKDEQEFKKESG